MVRWQALPGWLLTRSDRCAWQSCCGPFRFHAVVSLPPLNSKGSIPNSAVLASRGKYKLAMATGAPWHASLWVCDRDRLPSLDGLCAYSAQVRRAWASLPNHTVTCSQIVARIHTIESVDCHVEVGVHPPLLQNARSICPARPPDWHTSDRSCL